MYARIVLRRLSHGTSFRLFLHVVLLSRVFEEGYPGYWAISPWSDQRQASCQPRLGEALDLGLLSLTSVAKGITCFVRAHPRYGYRGFAQAALFAVASCGMQYVARLIMHVARSSSLCRSCLLMLVAPSHDWQLAPAECGSCPCCNGPASLPAGVRWLSQWHAPQ